MNFINLTPHAIVVRTHPAEYDRLTAESLAGLLEQLRDPSALPAESIAGTEISCGEVSRQLAECQRVFPPSGTVARVTLSSRDSELVDGIPCVFTEMLGSITNLPEEQDDTMLIVSSMVAQQFALLEEALLGKRYRCDIVAPDTGPTAIRFPAGHPQAGQIEAVVRFQSF